MAVQVRGGPSKHESTGWVLVSSHGIEKEVCVDAANGNSMEDTGLKVILRKDKAQSNWAFLDSTAELAFKPIR